MYDYFRGPVENLNPTQVTIECEGVGYQLHISLYTYEKLKKENKAKVFAHLVVREDAHLLFGFADEEERSMFRELINVSGVGATTARIILSSMDANQLRQVIAQGDANTLQKIKGIGAKTAQRMVVDLQDKMRKLGSGSAIISSGLHNSSHEEALKALLTLGFARASAEKAIQQAMKSLGSSPPLEGLIKVALSYL